MIKSFFYGRGDRGLQIKYLLTNDTAMAELLRSVSTADLMGGGSESERILGQAFIKKHGDKNWRERLQSELSTVLVMFRDEYERYR